MRDSKYGSYTEGFTASYFFRLDKNQYREQYEHGLKNEKGLDYLVMLLKQKYDS